MNVARLCRSVRRCLLLKSVNLPLIPPSFSFPVWCHLAMMPTAERHCEMSCGKLKDRLAAVHPKSEQVFCLGRSNCRPRGNVINLILPLRLPIDILDLEPVVSDDLLQVGEGGMKHMMVFVAADANRRENNANCLFNLPINGSIAAFATINIKAND